MCFKLLFETETRCKEKRIYTRELPSLPKLEVADRVEKRIKAILKESFPKQTEIENLKIKIRVLEGEPVIQYETKIVKEPRAEAPVINKPDPAPLPPPEPKIVYRDRDPQIIYKNTFEPDEFFTGLMHLTGYGKPQNYYQAMLNFETARESNLTTLQHSGKSINNAQYVKMIETFTTACTCLGKMY